MSIANPRHLLFGSACEVRPHFVQHRMWEVHSDHSHMYHRENVLASARLWSDCIPLTWHRVEVSESFSIETGCWNHIWRARIFLSGGLIGSKILMKSGHGNDACIKCTDSKTVLQWDSLKVWQLLQVAFKNYIYGNDMCLINLVTVLLPNQVKVIL